jgi:hypothetical protein
VQATFCQLIQQGRDGAILVLPGNERPQKQKLTTMQNIFIPGLLCQLRQIFDKSVNKTVFCERAKELIGGHEKRQLRERLTKLLWCGNGGDSTQKTLSVLYSHFAHKAEKERLIDAMYDHY